jgi:hypothetical protein
MDSVEEAKDSRHTGKWNFLVAVSLSCSRLRDLTWLPLSVS